MSEKELYIFDSKLQENFRLPCPYWLLSRQIKT